MSGKIKYLPRILSLISLIGSTYFIDTNLPIIIIAIVIAIYLVGVAISNRWDLE